MTMSSYQFIKTETRGKVALITLHRPEAMNALSTPLLTELMQALDTIEVDANLGATVITGGEQVFAAGADIKEMADKQYADVLLGDFPHGREALWARFAALRKPIIAAVAGYALGAGCELAMACDFILAADSAQFGQPEIKLGTMPGAGGTQRLARLVGKSKAMEMCLTGRFMDAAEAERAGMVSRILPVDQLIAEAVKAGEKIAALSLPAVILVKEAVNVAYETSLREGLRVERRMFQGTFATEDRKEGVQAFIEKRKPVFRNR